MNNFNMLKAWPAWTCGAMQLLELDACGARAVSARGTFIHAERERKKEKSFDTYVLIDCLDFYLLNNLDSIISMQIFYFIFFTKIRDFFFSINRDLTHLIWTQKKIKFFTLLILLLVFLLKF